MIIGNNNPNNNQLNKQPNYNSNFTNRFNTINEEAKKNNGLIKPFANDTKQQKYYDVTNKNDMYEKSFSMLQDRLNNGLISLDEFNKKCNQLNKLRQK